MLAIHRPMMQTAATRVWHPRCHCPNSPSCNNEHCRILTPNRYTHILAAGVLGRTLGVVFLDHALGVVGMALMDVCVATVGLGFDAATPILERKRCSTNVVTEAIRPDANPARSSITWMGNGIGPGLDFNCRIVLIGLAFSQDKLYPQDLHMSINPVKTTKTKFN